MVKGKKIGLFFGSFNPVHTGHLIIAEFMATRTGLDQVWFVVSPHNPLKERNTLARDQARLQMVRLALEENPKLKASNIEFSLPKPSYTVDTMIYLHEKYPQHQFSLIMGSDNLAGIEKWKNYKVLLANYPIHVYNRKDWPVNEGVHSQAMIKSYDLPLLDISSTFIRQSLKEGKSIRYMVHDQVWQYLEGSGLYRQ